MAALTGRLLTWDGKQPDLRAWSDADLQDGLRQLGIVTDRAQFTAQVAGKTQTEQEEDWLQESGVTDEGLQVFVWLAVRELWQRWELPYWPLDRLGRMFAYLVDADYAAEYADQLHAPTAVEVFVALESWLDAQEDQRAAVDGLVEQLGMPPQAWPGKLLEAMAEWSEVGHLSLAERGGAFLTRVLGHGHALIFLATALVSARMLDRAVAAALEVPLDADLRFGFAELCGHLCLAGGDRTLADAWLARSEQDDGTRASERTFAAETIHSYLATWRATGRDEATPVADSLRAAARQAAAQSAYYAWMAFAGEGAGPGGATQ